MAINAVNNVNFEGEKKKGSSGIAAGTLTGLAAGGASYALWKSPIKNEQLAGLTEDEFVKLTKDANLDDATKNTVTGAIKDKAKIADEVAEEVKNLFPDDKADPTNKILGGTAEELKTGLVNKEGKVTKEVYESFLKQEKEGKVLKTIESVAEKLKDIKVKSWKKAAIVGTVTALIVRLLAKSSGSEAHKA